MPKAPRLLLLLRVRRMHRSWELELVNAMLDIFPVQMDANASSRHLRLLRHLSLVTVVHCTLPLSDLANAHVILDMN